MLGTILTQRRVYVGWVPILTSLGYVSGNFVKRLSITKIEINDEPIVSNINNHVRKLPIIISMW